MVRRKKEIETNFYSQTKETEITVVKNKKNIRVDRRIDRRKNKKEENGVNEYKGRLEGNVYKGKLEEQEYKNRFELEKIEQDNIFIKNDEIERIYEGSINLNAKNVIEMTPMRNVSILSPSAHIEVGASPFSQRYSSIRKLSFGEIKKNKKLNFFNK